MDVRTIVVVPVKDQLALTEAFLDSVSEDADAILVLDNGSTRETRRALRRRDDVEVIDASGLGIYEMWNAGFTLARIEPIEVLGLDDDDLPPTNVLVSNNDIVLPPGGLRELAAALRSGPEDLWAVYPDYNRAWDLRSSAPTLAFTEGVLGDGGLFGACFMLKGEAIPWTPLIDDLSYEWWYGDNHLARRIADEGGRQARLVGLPVAHVNEGTARGHPGINEMKGRDRRRWMDSQRRHRGVAPRRRVVPGTKVWSPRGRRLDGE